MIYALRCSLHMWLSMNRYGLRGGVLSGASIFRCFDLRYSPNAMQYLLPSSATSLTTIDLCRPAGYSSEHVANTGRGHTACNLGQLHTSIEVDVHDLSVLLPLGFTLDISHRLLHASYPSASTRNIVFASAMMSGVMVESRSYHPHTSLYIFVGAI